MLRSFLRKSSERLSILPVLLCFFSGTVHTPTKVLDLDRGNTVKTSMLSSILLRRPAGTKPKTVVSDAAYADFLMVQGKYNLNRLRAMVAMTMKGQGGKLSVFFQLCMQLYAHSVVSSESAGL
jgi:hypothetical protein